MEKGFGYEQRTGNLWLINGQFDCPIDQGYAGRGVGINNPEAEDRPGIGPIPQGIYRMRVMASRSFAAPAIYLDPEEATAETLREYGRSGFWVHGDNSRADRSASRGCIVLDLLTRRSMASLMQIGFDRLKVVA